MTGGIDVPRLVAAQRQLMLWFVVQISGQIGTFPLAYVYEETLFFELLHLGSTVLLLVTIIALSSYAFRTAAALGSDIAWLWAIAMLAPCLNALTLLTLSLWAARQCRENGIPTGIFGPKL